MPDHPTKTEKKPVRSETAPKARAEGHDRIRPRTVKVKAAAVYTSLSQKTIRAEIKAGRLPFIQRKRGTSPYLLDLKDLDEYMEARKVPARA